MQFAQPERVDRFGQQPKATGNTLDMKCRLIVFISEIQLIDHLLGIVDIGECGKLSQSFGGEGRVGHHEDRFGSGHFWCTNTGGMRPFDHQNGRSVVIRLGEKGPAMPLIGSVTPSCRVTI